MITEFKNDNDYSVGLFAAGKFLGKVQYVNSLGALCLWLPKTKYKDWDTMNVYVRRSGRFIGQYKIGSFIPSKPL